jgi:hypothetical protein
MLLTTPLPSSTIVLGKWWGTFRLVLLLAVLPSLTVAGLAAGHRLPLALPVLLLMAALVLAYGAAATSLGLAAATWFARPVQALAAGVIPYLAVAAGWFFLLMLLFPGGSEFLRGMACASPFFGPGLLTAQMEDFGPGFEMATVIADLVWIGLYSYGAVLLLLLVVGSFDRCVGRFSGGYRRMRPHGRKQGLPAGT